MLDNHPCNPYCRDGQHADIAHFEPRYWTDGEIAAAWRRRGGVRVTRIIRNIEHPSRDGVGPAHLVVWEDGR